MSVFLFCFAPIVVVASVGVGGTGVMVVSFCLYDCLLLAGPLADVSADVLAHLPNCSYTRPTRPSPPNHKTNCMLETIPAREL